MNPKLNRKNFLRTAAGLSLATPQLINGRILPTSPLWPLKDIKKTIKIIGDVIVVTKTVLEVLKEFDIDIAKSIEDFVRAYLYNSYPRMTLGKGAPIYERQISKPGRYNLGECQVGELGYTTIYKKSKPHDLWTSSINLWAGIGDKVESNDVDAYKLHNTRCGFPVRPIKAPRNNKNYTVVTQHFEKGQTRIIVDHTMGEDIESILRRNLDEEVWLPS